MSKIAEFFGNSTEKQSVAWSDVLEEQRCPFLAKRCYKVRKSDPTVSIGTCTVLYGRPLEPIVICPTRFIQRRQLFTGCLHLLTTHEPGNELHVVSEVSIPGGSVDYFLVSVKDGEVKDFVGIEIQTLDTTGTVWPERQKFLEKEGLLSLKIEEKSKKTFGMNWKMTAKTILVQMHHKVQTFEHIHKKLALVIQDKLLDYMVSEFKFDHLKNPASINDSMHFHAYKMKQDENGDYRISMKCRLSTDADGIAVCLGLQAEARIELEQITELLQTKISSTTLFQPV